MVSKDKGYECKKRWRENNRDKVRESQRKYYENNKEKVKESKRRWIENNPGKRKEIDRRYYLENKDKAKEWRKNNVGKVREYKLKWERNNLEKRRISVKARRINPIKEKCEWCGSEDYLQRHHPDYSRPNYIITLCAFCHNKTKDFKRRFRNDYAEEAHIR